MSLKQDIVNATFWGMLDSFGSKITRFIIGIFLARLLFPEELGQIAMVYIFFECASILINSGFQAALVQKKNVTVEDQNSVFYLNVSIAIFVGFVLFLFSESIAIFFETPVLTDVVRVLSFVPLINAISIVHIAVFHKKMDFRTMFFANFSGILFSGVVCLMMAANGFGIWSLVAQQVLYPMVTTSVFFFKSPFRPSLIFSWSAIRQLSDFSLNLLLADLINKLFSGLYFVVIGKFYSAAMLGFYARADGLMKFPSLALNSVLSRVMFPAAARVKDDKQKVKQIGKKTLGVTAFAIFPLMSFLSASAENFIPFLLTEKWNFTIGLFSLLCLVGAVHNLSEINLDLLQSLGRARTLLKLQVFHKCLVVIGLLLTFDLGLFFIIYGQIAMTIVMFAASSHVTGKFTGYGLYEQLCDCFPYILYSLLIFVLAKTVTHFFVYSNFVEFLLQLMVCGITYFMLLSCMKDSKLTELKILIKNMIVNKKS
ncbi:MAG: lipopolysaccharide biosynthesis protein [Arenicella sp.]